MRTTRLLSEISALANCVNSWPSILSPTSVSSSTVHSPLNKASKAKPRTSTVAYRATVPYLLEQSGSTSFTLCTGSQGDIGARAAPAITQGPLFSLSNVACRDNETTNVRFNEVYLACRVEVDSSAEKTGAMKASDFAKVYTELLARPDIKSERITVATQNDLTDLKHKKKIAY